MAAGRIPATLSTLDMDRSGRKGGRELLLRVSTIVKQLIECGSREVSATIDLCSIQVGVQVKQNHRRRDIRTGSIRIEMDCAVGR